MNRKTIDLPDVDIEVLDRDHVAGLFPEAHPASLKVDNHLTRHRTGLYFQDIPTDPDGLAALPQALAQEKGFYKIDLLPAPFPYAGIATMQELRDWLAEPIDWRWFTHADFVTTIFHLSGTVHLHSSIRPMAEVVVQYEPRSIVDLACMIAIKMPAKKHLIGSDWPTIWEHIWVHPADGKYFKKAHAVAYAIAAGIDARRKAPEFFRR